MRERLEKLADLLPKNIDCALIKSEENRFYFTGFASSLGFLIVSRNGCKFLTDSRYIEAAKREIKHCKVEELDNFTEQLSEIFARFKVKTVAVEAEKMTVAQLQKLKDNFKTVKFDGGGDLDVVISELRSKKDTQEIESIKKAQIISSLAFEHILGYIIPGMTEKDIALELEIFMKRNGAQAVSFETIVVSGANSSMPHGVPSEKKAERGDFITMDFGAVWNGYHSDMTRTVALGEISSRQEKIYKVVLEAQMRAIESIRAGVLCKDADEAARAVIRKEGFGDFFGHGTGHGVGVEIHEGPNLSPRSDGILEQGNVVTVEPGIYLPGEFGVRIEDMVAVTESGCENLTNVQKELMIIKN